MKYFIKIGLLVDIYLICCLFVFRQLGFYPFFNKKPLILELLNISWEVPMIIGLLISTINIILMYFLIKKIFSDRTAYIASLVYVTSVWSVYLGIFSLTNILSVLFLQFLALGLLFKRSTPDVSPERKGNPVVDSKKGSILAVLGIMGLLSLSVLFWIPLLGIELLIIFNAKDLNLKIKNIFIFSIIWLILLLTIGFKNPDNLKNEFLREISIFQDVGLINTVNNFQGELKNTSWGGFGRIIDNKYSYLSLKVLANLLSQFSLVNFFGSNTKLLQFSTQPPILLGFLAAFAIGIKKIFKLKRRFLFLSIFLLLTIPSILADKSPDLNRLFIIFPLFCLIIALGVDEIQKRHKKIFLVVCLLLVFQGFVVTSDIFLREPLRLAQLVQRVYGKNN